MNNDLNREKQHQHFKNYHTLNYILIIMEADKNPLSAVPCVQISPEGIFKYILIKAIVEDKGQNQNLIFVRGSAKREYHAENFKDFIKEV